MGEKEGGGACVSYPSAGGHDGGQVAPDGDHHMVAHVLQQQEALEAAAQRRRVPAAGQQLLHHRLKYGQTPPLSASDTATSSNGLCDL